MSHFFAVVVVVGAVPPGQRTPVKVTAPAVPDGGVQRTIVMCAPAMAFEKPIVVAEVPIFMSC